MMTEAAKQEDDQTVNSTLLSSGTGKPENLVFISWDCCPECGAGIGVAEQDIAGEHAEETVYDNATAYCLECSVIGDVCVHENGGASISWYD